MARRRKSTGNTKTKENQSKVKTNPETLTIPVKEPDDAKETSSATDEALQEQQERPHETVVADKNENSQEILMPIDIQQMILGDLQSGNKGEDIVVSRETVGDSSEGDPELEASGSQVVETVREEEYEMQSEDEEGQQIIYINEDDAEEGQYVIVVNGDDFEMTGEEGQEEMIRNITGLTEGSCEIITVVRGSDYESSQESGDEVEECDNINAVIGDIDGMHCVKISQYDSDDESNNLEAIAEREGLSAAEKEVIANCLGSEHNVQHIIVHESSSCENSQTGEKNESEQVEESSNAESNLVTNEKETTETSPQGECKPAVSEKYDLRRMEVLTQVITNAIEKVQFETATKEFDKQVESNSTLGNEESTAMEVDVDETPSDETPNDETPNDETPNDGPSEKVEENVTEVTECTNTAGMSQTQSDTSKTVNVDNISGKKDHVRGRSKRKDNSLDEPRVLRRGTRKGRSSGIQPDSIEPSNVNSTKNVPIEPETKLKTLNFVDRRPSSLDNETTENFLQEDKVTSNSSTSENSSSNISEESVLLKLKSTSDNESIKEVKSESSALDNLNSIIPSEPNLPKVNNDSSSEVLPVNQDLFKVEHKDASVKETLKVDEEKQNLARSRSGSTDTTGSESGSTSSSSRRRSGRIKSISSLKQEADILKCVSPSAPVVSSTTTPPVPKYETDKPVKVKSRWRRSSELEMGSGNRRMQEIEVISANSKLADSVMSGRPTTPPYTPPLDEQVEDILSTFQQITFNEFLTERSTSKEAKRMVCDCTLTKEEIARGDMGCGEDCLNRLLMIECGSRCMLGERCANKRFQNVENAKCEIFKTDKKGYGLKALEDLPPDTFLLEYVGEVLDPKEFRKRAKEYSKDKNLHFYFMALKSDSIIDATHKGNISRFINHSCEPNAETQKWTVNGELRIGFFSKCAISAGEEITFDYKFQRYGKEAQRCFCESANCRGWIGEDPEKENKNVDASSRSKEKKDKKKKEDKKIVKDILDDMDLEEEIEKLVLKNRAQTLLLSRLMVRAEEPVSRSALLGTLQRGETACLRLFLDYHGLRLIWSWMMDPATNSALKVEILETLAKLPIPNKTMLQDSKVLSVVEKWSSSAQPVKDAKDRSSTEDESDKGEADKEKLKAKEIEKNSDDSNSSKTNEVEDEADPNKGKIVELSNNLLKEWSVLKEVFRIPKKERIEQMKEHEREADEVYRDGGSEKQDKSYDRSWSRNEYDRRDKERDRKRGRDSPDSDRSRKSSKIDDKQSHLTKMERRQLFAIKVAQEEEERLRRQHENQWQEQVQRAAQEMAAQEMAAQEAAANANHFTGFPGFPPPHQWMGFPPPDTGMMPPPHLEGQPMFHNNPPPFLFNQNPHLSQHPPFLDPQPFPMFNQPPPLPKQPLLPNPPLMHTPPLPKQPYEPPLQSTQLPMSLPMMQPPLPNHPPPVVVSAPFQNGLPSHAQFTQPLTFSQPPPLPKAPPVVASSAPVFQSPAPVQIQPPLPQVPVTSLPQAAMATIPVPAAPSAPLYLPVKLPPKWRSAKDAAGRTYYYHMKTRVSQWEPPIFQAQTAAQQSVQQESESESESSDSEEDSTSEEEEQEEDKTMDEEMGEDMTIEDELGVEELGEDSPYEPETMELLEDIEEETKTRHSSLVQERIISPRTADEIPDKFDKRKIRQLKEKLRREKSKEKLRQKLKKSKLKGRSGTSKCEADTSSDPARKIKDAFRLSMAGVIVHYLNYYRKPDAKIGKITNTEDFKHLARKLTHFVMVKELKHCRSIDDLHCNDNVKHKARDFIKKYMAKFGPVYQRASDKD